MKKIIFIFILIAVVSACSNNQDTLLPEINPAVYSENFSVGDEEPEFNFEGWTKFSEAGTKEWFKNAYQGNDYIEFSSFASGQSSNIGWVISPPYNLDLTNKKQLVFQSAQHHATSFDNKFEVFISNNFDGTHVLSANWKKLNFNAPQYSNATNYDFVNSGAIDLSAYSGIIYIAFRVTGNGLYNSNQSGGFQVDNIKLF